jgi:hypothetical protein
MVLGIDFDNTIVSYEGVFHRIAIEDGLIPKSLSTSKGAVRDYLRDLDQEDIWTEMQGLVYGTKMDMANPYPDVINFFKFSKKAQLPTRIISHKTLYPFKGERNNLHESASNWLKNHGFFESFGIGMDRNNIFFETTQEAKINRIQKTGCTHFIDDLPEFLLHPNFPNEVERWLFDPVGIHKNLDELRRFKSWNEIRLQVAKNLVTVDD